MKKLVVTILLFTTATLYAQLPGAGPRLWLKADAGVHTNGTNIITWEDQSGNKLNATTTTPETPPQYIKNVVNGLPAIRFNGVDNGMETIPFQTFPEKRGTVIVVLKVRALSETSGVGYGTFVSTYFNKGITWQIGSKGTLGIYYDGEGMSGFPIAEMTTGRWSVVMLVRDSDSSMQYLRDGVIKYRYRIRNNQPDINPLKIASNGRLEVLNGDLAEVIVYDKALNEAEIAGVYSYVENKYKLEVQVPEVTRNEWWPYLLLLIPVFVIAILVTRFISQRKLKKKLAELERERIMDNERQRISREMHDEIGAGLTQITLMSESARNRNTGEGNQELEGIAETSRKLVNSMGEIIWSLSPENKTLSQLTAYMREQLGKQLEYSGIDHKIILPDEDNDILLSNDFRRNILMVTKEIVNNAIKHSGATKISIEAKRTGHLFTMKVHDNGKGFDESKDFSGNGLRNIRHRIAELNGKLSITSKPGSGSTFQYEILVPSTT